MNARGGVTMKATSASEITASPDLFEIVEGKLYGVGGKIPLDGRASWAPAGATGYQPCQAYLLRGDEDVLVDPGIAAVCGQVMSGLSQLLEDGAPLRVFLTRAQLDCVGNIGEVASRYELVDIFTGGLFNPFDQFDAAAANDREKRAANITVTRSGEDPPLEIVATSLRLLATFWGYDAETRTVFTSDSFTHVTVDEPTATPVTDSTVADRSTRDDLEGHLFSTFWWLPLADRRAIVDGLETF